MAAPGYLGTSQNGWPVYDDEHWQQHAVRFEVEGVGFWAANDDVAVVMGDFIQKYHDHIEPITLAVAEWPGYDDWSRALRPVRGQTSGFSNHGSCTACDLNSTRHPRGVHNTYSAAHRAALRELVNEYHGVLRSGEFYGPNSTIDGMHIEINTGPAAVKAEADRIRKLKTQEADMPLNDADIDKIWNADRIPVMDTDDPTKPADPKNPNWQVDSAIAQILKVVVRSEDRLGQLQKTINAQAGEISALKAQVAQLQTPAIDHPTTTTK